MHSTIKCARKSIKSLQYACEHWESQIIIHLYFFQNKYLLVAQFIWKADLKSGQY